MTSIWNNMLLCQKCKQSTKLCMQYIVMLWYIVIILNYSPALCESRYVHVRSPSFLAFLLWEYVHVTCVSVGMKY